MRIIMTAMEVVAIAVLLGGCGGDSQTSIQLTCFNNGDGSQECIDGSGNVTSSPCVTVNGQLVTSTGAPCDASQPVTTTTTTNPPGR